MKTNAFNLDEALFSVRKLAVTVFESGRYPPFHTVMRRMYGASGNNYIEVMDEEKTISSIQVTMLRGMEAGLSALTALHNIVYFNNRPCLWGDVALAMVQAHPDYRGMSAKESTEEGSEHVVVTIYRDYEGEIVPTSRSYGKYEANKYGLLDQPHYQKDPMRMFMIRARTYAMRDTFADALQGLSIAEEQRDFEIMNDMDDPKSAGKKNPGFDRLFSDTVDEFTAEEVAKREAALKAAGKDGKPDFSTLKKPAKKKPAKKALAIKEETKAEPETWEMQIADLAAPDLSKPSGQIIVEPKQPPVPEAKNPLIAGISQMMDSLIQQEDDAIVADISRETFSPENPAPTPENSADEPYLPIEEAEILEEARETAAPDPEIKDINVDDALAKAEADYQARQQQKRMN